MKTILHLIVMVVIVRAVLSGDDLSCYDCVISETTGSLASSTTCPQFYDPSKVSTCSGKICMVKFSDYGPKGFTQNSTCLSNLVGVVLPDDTDYKVEDCLLLNRLQSKYEFYLHDDVWCCVSTSEVENIGSEQIQYNRTVCVCDTNYCNGNVTSFFPNFTPKSFPKKSDQEEITRQTQFETTSTSHNATNVGCRSRSSDFVFSILMTITTTVGITRSH